MSMPIDLTESEGILMIVISTKLSFGSYMK